MQPPFGTYAPSRRARVLIGLARWFESPWISRRVAHQLGKRLYRGRDEPFDVCVQGFRMRLMPRDNGTDHWLLLRPGLFDAVERAAIRASLRDRFVFVDIGANSGAYSLSLVAAARRGGLRIRCVAIEAEPTMAARLRFNVEINGFREIAVEQCACADRTGRVRLSASSGNRAQIGIVDDGEPGIDVPARPLLDTLRAHGIERVDALKADIEGAEDRALIPFFTTAPPALWPALLVVEDTSRARWEADLLAVLAERGYRLQGRAGENRILARTG